MSREEISMKFMIDQLTKEVLDIAYRGFTPQLTSPKKFSSLNLANLKIAIRQMFALMRIEKDLYGLDRINIIELNSSQFAYVNCCNSNIQNFKYVDIDNCKKCALELADETDILKHYSLDFACSNGNNVIINSCIIPEKLGLHLVCHEIMHSLASPNSVAKLRENKEFGDEAINEFFARLASMIFNSIDNTFESLTGATYWEDDKLFKSEISQHNEELGLYGKLLQTDSYLTCDAWNEETTAYPYLCKIANFYFNGIYPEY